MDTISKLFKDTTKKLFSGSKSLVLKNEAPSYLSLEKRFSEIKEFGLYLHIPFCRQICCYCPYNKEIYRPETAKLYLEAVRHEINFYKKLIGCKPVTSFYIGGGTPTTILHDGLFDILPGKLIYDSLKSCL